MITTDLFFFYTMTFPVILLFLVRAQLRVVLCRVHQQRVVHVVLHACLATQGLPFRLYATTLVLPALTSIPELYRRGSNQAKE